MALQEILLERAVRHHLPSAFATLLERVKEFEVGKVLVLHKKPHFWRRHHQLDFTSLSLTALLNESEDLHVRTQSSVEFTNDTVSSKNIVTLNVDADAELGKHCLCILGKVKGKKKSLVNMHVDFGTVEHVVSDLFHALSARQWTVDASNPVVRDALQKGMEMYVISSVYQASKVDIKVRNCQCASLPQNSKHHFKNYVLSLQTLTFLIACLCKLLCSYFPIVVAIADTCR